MNEKPYTFRKLKADDIMPMVKIISKIGFNEFSEMLNPDSLKAFTENNKKTADVVNQLGLKIFLQAADVILKNLPSCEDDVFTLLASVTELSVEEVKNFELNVFFELLVDFFKKEEFKSFIKVVLRFIK